MPDEPSPRPSLLSQGFRLVNPLAGYPFVWGVGKRYLWSAPFVALGGLLSSTLEGIGISFLIPLLGALMPGGGGGPSPQLAGPMRLIAQMPNSFAPAQRLPAVALIILGFILLKGVVGAINSVFIGWIDGKAANDLRKSLVRRLTEVGYPFYLKNDPAELLTIISTQSWTATEAIRTIYSLISDVAALFVFGTLLFIVDWRMTLVVAVLSLPISLFQNMFKERIRKLGDRVSEANHRLGQRMLVVVEAFRMIKIFNQEQAERDRFAGASDNVRQRLMESEVFGACLGPILETAHAALFMCVMLGAYWAGVSGPVLLTFLVLLYRTQPFIQSIDGGRLSLVEASTPLSEVEWILDPSDKPKPPSGSRRFEGLTGPIVFDGVSFGYPNRPSARPALDQVSFMVEPGKVTALIGRSGSGKTTLVNITCQLLQPTAGRVLVGDVDLRDLDTFSWREKLGFAGQDVELIEGSITDNITYGCAGASMDDIREAARIADAVEFIEAMPQGFDTPVGNRGLSLSGGQRQRIGIARALLRRPAVLILDEATSAVDGMSEQAILTSVRGQGITAIVVSHRASTLSYCDQGVVLDKGRVVEHGPLMSLEAFRRLSKLTPA